MIIILIIIVALITNFNPVRRGRSTVKGQLEKLSIQIFLTKLIILIDEKKATELLIYFFSYNEKNCIKLTRIIKI